MPTSRSIATVLALAALALPGAAAARLKVVATMPSLAAIAREVGGEQVEVEALTSPRQDPHYVDPRPNLVLKLNGADLLLINGLELEVGWLPTVLLSARNPRINVGGPGYLDASQFPRLKEVPASKIDRSMGDIHPGGNPHFLFDPRAAAVVARGVAARMSTLDPEHAAAYEQRGAAVAERLLALAAEQTARFTALPPERRKVVTYHRSLPYVLDWLQLTAVAEIEPKPGTPPDPGHVAHVLATMRSTGTKVILQEEFYPTSTSKTLAGLAPARLVTLPGGARFADGESIDAHFQSLAEEIHRALQP